MSLLHGVRRLPGGGVRVRLSARERDLLRTLPEQLRTLLTAPPDGAETDAVHARLFPPAYDDPAADAEFRDMVGDSVLRERMDAVETFARTLDEGEGALLSWSVDLSGEQAQAWLSALNDARLTLGVLLGVDSEQDWEDPADPDEPTTVLLYYLGWLQEELLDALMGDLG